MSYAFCRGRNKDGRPCGNKVATLPSGVYVKSGYCPVHRKRRVDAHSITKGAT